MRARIRPRGLRASLGRLVAAGCVLASGCAHEPPAPRGEPETRLHLASSASYQTLAGRVDVIGSSGIDRSGPRCLVRVVPDGFELHADLAPAVSPLPPVEPDALSALRNPATLRLVTRWGTDGDAGPYVGTFTHHPPLVDHFAIVIAVSGERASLRSTIADGPHEDDLERTRVVARLDGVRARQPLLVVVADGAVHMDVIVRWLAALDALELPVAFGMVLRTDRELPGAPASAGGAATGRCTALPDLTEPGPLGAMTPLVLREALPALREAVTRCAALVPSRAVATGGRLRLGVRIDAAGRAREACVTDDTVEDDAFRICLVEAARSLAWPSPTSPGYVDVYLPLVLAPDRTAFQRGVCVP